MAENENVNTESTEVDENQETVETPENKEQKVFQQSDVDRIVKNRVASKNKELSDLKANWEAEKTEYTKQIETLEKTIGDLLSSQIEGLDEPTKKLLAKLPILDQIEWLNEFTKNEKQQNSKIFGTPKPNTSGESKVTPLYKPSL